MNYSSLHEPFIVLHAMERYDSALDNLHYAVVVSVDYGKCKNDVYAETRVQFNKLEVPHIKSRNQLLVEI